jgi:hypothetical protein
MSIVKRLLLGVFVAALVLLAAEGVLRLAGVAAPEPFFHEQHDADGRAWMVSNPSAGDNWFFGAEWEDLVRRPRHERFEVDKPADRFRIFVLGESSAYGSPLADNATWASQLEHLLNAAQGEKRVEVINVALRAVSADIYRDVLPELHGFEPDLFVLYAGHNEYYGVRSERVPRTSRLFRALRAMRDPGRLTSAETEQLGLQAGAHIPAGGSQERAVAQRFERSLDSLVAGARGVPLLVYLPWANERHLAPMCSGPGEADVATVAEADSLLFHAAADPAGLSDASCAKADALAAPAHAGLRWVRGWCSLGAGDTDRARQYFRESIDLDCLPIRARSSLLEVLRGLPSRQHPGAPVAVVDPGAALFSVRPALALGHEVFYDHVHLNILGSYLVAREGALAVSRQPGLFGLAVDAADIDNYGDTREGLRISQVDDWLATERTLRFFDRSIVQSVASRSLSEAFFEAENALLAEPFDEVTTSVLGDLAPGDDDIWLVMAEDYERHGFSELALLCTRRAVLAQPDCGRCHRDLALRLAANGQALQARDHALQAMMLAIPERDLAPALR